MSVARTLTRLIRSRKKAMIVCCGEALIDMIPRPVEDGDQAFLPIPGGAIFNTAIGLGRLGQATGFVSGISNDMFGSRLVDALRASGVSDALLHRSDNPTTLAFVELSNGQAQYTFYDENSATRQIHPEDLPAIDETVQALHFGAISLISEPCGSTYEHLLQQHAGKTLISIDPNVRPLFINDPDSYRARLKRMIGSSDIIKVSDEDLAWLEPSASWSDVAAHWLSEGAALVVRTRGEYGADAVTTAESITVDAVKSEVIDTIGAGDTFNAGLLARLNQLDLLSREKLQAIDRQNLNDMLQYAARVAAITVSRAGANPPWASELDHAI